MSELEVQPGQQIQLTARHDTYSISFSLPPELSESCGSVQEQAGGQAMQLDSGTSQGTVGTGSVAPEGSAGQPRSTGVPLVDPAWQAAFGRLQEVNGQLAKTCVQNPLEYRAVAKAAVQFAARPHDFGLDAQQAAEFCAKMMG